MPVYATRKLRNTAAALMLLSGLTHVGQLWFNVLDGEVIIAALLGMFYLLISLGLSGQSRFSLWIAVLLPATGAFLASPRVLANPQQALLLWHILADLGVVLLCLYILFKTRHAEMD